MTLHESFEGATGPLFLNLDFGFLILDWGIEKKITCPVE